MPLYWSVCERSTFLSTPSVGRATGRNVQGGVHILISIHALRGEGDPPSVPAAALPYNFYPRPPWGGRPASVFAPCASLAISIHALRGEGDGQQQHYPFRHLRISIHALRGEGDGRESASQKQSKISIHALRGEGDQFPANQVELVAISIHALRGEGDSHHAAGVESARYFYPRPPWGGRRRIPGICRYTAEFLSTPSVGRATETWARCSTALPTFLSTPSVGRATV